MEGLCYPPFEFYSNEYKYWKACPQICEEVDSKLYENSLNLLKKNYPIFFRSFVKHNIIKKKIFWGINVNSLSTLDLLSGGIIALNSEFQKEIYQLKSNEIDLLIYFLFVHTGSELFLRDYHKIECRDINTELISFIALGKAYYNLTKQDKECLKQIKFERKDNRIRSLQDLISYFDNYDEKTITSISSWKEILNFLGNDPSLNTNDYDEIVVKQIMMKNNIHSIMNQKILNDFLLVIQTFNKLCTIIGSLIIFIVIISQILGNQSISSTIYLLIEVSLLTIVVTVNFYTYHLIKKIFQTNIYQTSECPWENVIDVSSRSKLGNPGDDEFCRSIRCPLFPHEDKDEICKIRIDKKSK